MVFRMDASHIEIREIDASQVLGQIRARRAARFFFFFFLILFLFYIKTDRALPFEVLHTRVQPPWFCKKQVG